MRSVLWAVRDLDVPASRTEGAKRAAGDGGRPTTVRALAEAQGA